MKKYICEFIRRGMIACGIGPLVLAILYLVLRRSTGLESLEVGQVCMGILSLSALAFIAGGMNVLYQVERLPLMGAILLHGGVLYVSYLATYLLNGWLARGLLPLVTFTGVFLVGYLIIWMVIYAIIRKNTHTVNEQLKKKQRGD